jgi:glycerate kinase
MPFRVLIAPDKFKGTLTAKQAADSIAEGWMQSRPQDDLDLLPMSDGGDGFGEVMAALIGAEERTTETVDAAHRPRTAKWWFHGADRMAIIETAQIIGLALLPPNRFHPFELDTEGLAQVIRDSWDAGATKVILGIGGSATNDGGFGFARALGWSFLETSGLPIEKWVKLDRLDHWEAPAALPQIDYTVGVDVKNPLLGANGCTRVYGPQKGLRTEQAPLAEACLKKLADHARLEFKVEIANEPGAGAAGGLGFGLRAFLGARLQSGFDIFATQASLDEKIEQADLIITGEGSIDRQSMMGKGVGQMAERGRKNGKRCIALGGMVEGPHVLSTQQNQQSLFYKVAGIAPTLASPLEAKSRAPALLTRLAAKIAAEYRE